MGATISRLVGIGLLLLLSNSLAAAGAPDLRLVNAAAEENTQAVRALLDEGVDVNTPASDGVTALLWAAHWDNLEVADLLITAGADVNAAEDHGVTPLGRACENRSLAMVEKLLAAGADANLAQTSGLTPLMTAARTASVQVVQALLAAGADVNATTTETQSTALMWAVAEGHPEIVRVLLERGADVRTLTAKGFTPLMFAARNGDIALAETLIAAGADVNKPGADGTHVLPFAIISGHEAFALFLLEHGADPNGSMNGVHALHAAAGRIGTWLGDWYRRHGRGALGRGHLNPSGRLSLVKALLERGADPNARITSTAMFQSYIGYPKKGAFELFSCGTGNLRGSTPLWVAAFDMNGAASSQILSVVPSRTGSSAEIMQALLAAGADPHLTTDDGTTPLMAAAGLGTATMTPRQPRGVRSPSAEEAVRVLLEAGADINAVNEADFTTLHGAAYRGLNEVIEYLVAQGADINARDFRGRTPYRLAEGSKQSFQFQAWPETAALLKQLGANTNLGISGERQERPRDKAGQDVSILQEN